MCHKKQALKCTQDYLVWSVGCGTVGTETSAMSGIHIAHVSNFPLLIFTSCTSDWTLNLIFDF